VQIPFARVAGKRRDQLLHAVPGKKLS
jgi:hypothetical protein